MERKETQKKYFEYLVLIRGSVHMSILLCVHQKREAVCALPLPVTSQGSTPSLTNFVIYPLCFTGYTFCDVMSQLFSLKGGGASDPKNPDLYYYLYVNLNMDNYLWKIFYDHLNTYVSL